MAVANINDLLGGPIEPPLPEAHTAHWFLTHLWQPLDAIEHPVQVVLSRRTDGPTSIGTPHLVTPDDPLDPTLRAMVTEAMAVRLRKPAAPLAVAKRGRGSRLPELGKILPAQRGTLCRLPFAGTIRSCRHSPPSD